MANFLSIMNCVIFGLMNLLVLILVIKSANKTKKEELSPKCKKNFSKFFIGFLIFLMFATFFDFALSINENILSEIYGFDYPFLPIYRIIWGIAYGLSFLNQLIAFILLFSSMEINLFHKKSKGKFAILSIILLCGSFLLIIIEIVMRYVFPYGFFEPSEGSYIYTSISLPYAITQLVVVILTNCNYLIIGIIIFILLKKTTMENELFREFTKQLSLGVILLFIVIPLLHLLEIILTFIDFMIIINGNFESNFRIIYALLYLSIFYISSLVFIFGIIILTLGAIKTMSVPLIFSRKKAKKAIKVIKQIPEKICPNCEAPVPFGAQFCIKCGKSQVINND